MSTSTKVQKPSLRDIIKSEYKRCAKDPSYFLSKYAVVQHPIKGKIPFHLFPFQVDTLNTFLTYNHVIVLKARQIGLSTLVAGYSLWLMLFHSDKSILVIATKQDTAKNLVTKVRLMHSNLPVWLRGNCIEDNKLSLKFNNRSSIKAVSSSKDAGRSEALSLLVIDEAAHIEGAEEIWAASQSTTATGGQVIMLSTPNGIGNFFHKMWVQADADENDYKQVMLDWRVHPDRDQKWRDDQEKVQGAQLARQEHDADFITTGNTVIAGELIQYFKEKYVKDPIAKEGFDKNLWIWEYPDYAKTYVISADVARGDALDFSSCHVLDLDNSVQVAEYKGKMGTREFANFLVELSTKYNDALLIVENNNQGWDVCQTIIDRGYKNLFYMSKDLHYVDVEHQMTNKYYKEERHMVPGFTTTPRTRPLIISRLESYMREDSVIIQSIRTIDELFVFIWNGSKAEARSGYNDDLVMCLGVALWIRDTALRLKSEGIELQKLAINKFAHIKYDQVYTNAIRKPLVDPWELPMPSNQKENIRWLL